MCRKIMILMVSVCLLVGFIAPNVFAKGDKYELDLSLFIPEQHLRYQKVWKPWIEKIKMESGGRIIITPFFANALAPMPKSLEAVRNGIADIGEYAMFTAPGSFPLTEVVMLPQLAGKKMLDSYKATLIINHLYKTVPEVRAEYKGVKLLSIHAAPVSIVSTISKEITSLDQLKGLRLRTTGAKGAAIAKQLGFAAVNLPMGDMYLSLERGVLDGAFIGAELLVSRKWGEVLKHLVTNADFGADAVMCMVMNPESYNKLPADLKKVIDNNSGEILSKLCSKTWASFEAESLEVAQKSMGLQVSQLSPGQLEQLTKLMDPVKSDYVKLLNDKGLPGTAVFETAQKMAMELTAD
ncbi:TRAP transporter substrate-binding protein [Thermodesulfobacteriota bacterium]